MGLSGLSEPLRQFRSKLVTHAELEASGGVIKLIRLQRNTVIEPNRPDWQIQTQTSSDVGVYVPRAEVPRTRVHETSIIEHSQTNPIDDRNSVFDGQPSHRITADIITFGILGTDAIEVKTAQVVCASQKESIVNRHRGSATPVRNRCHFCVKKQNRVKRQVEILFA